MQLNSFILSVCSVTHPLSTLQQRTSQSQGETFLPGAITEQFPVTFCLIITYFSCYYYLLDKNQRNNDHSLPFAFQCPLSQNSSMTSAIPISPSALCQSTRLQPLRLLPVARQRPHGMEWRWQRPVSTTPATTKSKRSYTMSWSGRPSRWDSCSPQRHSFSC